MTRPDARELLDVARQTLLHELLPALPSELRYQTLMVANAMAIAAREYQAGHQSSVEERDRLREWFDDHQLSLESSRRRLATTIREGHYDAPKRRAGLVEVLRQTTLAQLAISNPKALP